MPHGPEWKKIAIALGSTGASKLSMEASAVFHKAVGRVGGYRSPYGTPPPPRRGWPQGRF